MLRDDHRIALSRYVFRCGLVVLIVIIAISSLPARAVPSQVIADSGLKAAPPSECPAQYPSPIGFLKLPFTDPDVVLYHGYHYNPGVFVGRAHNGIDYSRTDWGSFDVRAAYGGQARYIRSNGEWGNYVEIDHTINGRRFRTIYAHLESSNLSPGDVEQGAVIGRAGTTGFSKGIHLHFELWEIKGGGPVKRDPYNLCMNEQSGHYPQPGRSDQALPANHQHYWTSNSPRYATEPTANVDVMLIIDSSGSMDRNDTRNKRLEAAKAYLVASLDGDRVGVVDFATNARLASQLRTIVSGQNHDLIAGINTIGASGQTNIRAAITMACQELENNGQAPKRAAILLTDGEHNEGVFGNPQQCFANNAWPIFAIGFGSADMNLLGRIANDTGGEQQHIDNVSSLVTEFQRIRAKIAGIEPPQAITTHVMPLTTTALQSHISPGQEVATFASSWSGSDVVMSLVAPSGRTIHRNAVASDVTHDRGAAFEIYSITRPEPGQWAIRLYGADVPSRGEEVLFAMTTLPSPIRPWQNRVFLPLSITTGPVQAPVIDYRVDNASLVQGECTTFWWYVENASVVYLDGGVVGTYGSRELCPPNTTSYRLRVVGKDGSDRTHTVQVTVSPPQDVSAHFWAASDEIHRGECTVLQWDVQNAHSVELDGNAVASEDAVRVCPTNTRAYTLRAMSHQGSVTERHVMVTVRDAFANPPRIENVSAPTSVGRGQTFTVQWTLSSSAGFHKIDWWRDPDILLGAVDKAGMPGSYQQQITAPGENMILIYRIRASTGAEFHTYLNFVRIGN
jgi:murein DD-endopeptidase MepM/ murein hydrolase activator NlpD